MRSYPSYAVITLLDDTIQDIKYDKITKYDSSQFMDLNELRSIKDRSNKFNDFMAQIQNTFGSIEESFNISNPDDIYKKLTIPSEIKLIIDKYIS
jgi:hypothetical protein